MMNDKDISKMRWNFLKEAVKTKGLVVNEASVRNFDSYGFFQLEKISDKNMNIADKEVWYECRSELSSNPFLEIKYSKSEIDFEDMIGFDNTGNVCIWPSEEVMTAYCLENVLLFKGKSVLEVGGGMTCLAGLWLALTSESACIHLSDGNQTSVENVHAIVKRNKHKFTCRDVSVRQLVWSFDCQSTKYDIIIMADCFFFEMAHQKLLHTLQQSLKPQGVVLSFCPSRGQSMERFIRLSDSIFYFEIIHSYSARVTQRHHEMLDTNSYYAPDLHYPILVKFKNLKT